MTKPAPDLSAESCTKGCHAFRITTTLGKATGLKWSVTPDGSAFIARGSISQLEKLVSEFRPFIHESAGDPTVAIAVTTGDTAQNATLRILRPAAEIGDFIGKVKYWYDTGIAKERAPFAIEPVASDFCGTHATRSTAIIREITPDRLSALDSTGPIGGGKGR